jgi:hypothetical protein
VRQHQVRRRLLRSRLLGLLRQLLPPGRLVLRLQLPALVLRLPGLRAAALLRLQGRLACGDLAAGAAGAAAVPQAANGRAAG